MSNPLSPDELLAGLLKRQAELRALDQDERQEAQDEKEPQDFHRRIRLNEDQDASRDNYTSNSPASIPEGTPLIVSPTDGVIDVPWADYHRPAEEQGWTDFPCANGTDCGMIGGSCISNWDCGPDEVCKDNWCEPKDPNDPCEKDSDCPAPPSEEQFYTCIDGWCRPSCGDEDTMPCPEGLVCDPTSMFCMPGCLSDEECIPGREDSAPDARVGSFCVNYECVTPCERPIFCDGVGDRSCPADEDGYRLVCRDKIMRATGDPEHPLYECVDGCDSSQDCRPTEVALADFYCDPDKDEDCYPGDPLILRFPNQCVDDTCLRLCRTDNDCITVPNEQAYEGYGIYEVCVEGECRDQGKPCSSDSNCPKGEYCDENGNCKRGCKGDSDCFEDCDPDPDCVALCGPDPTCTCTDFYSGEDCGTSATEGWEDNCERDPACMANCPAELNCRVNSQRNWKCIENSCYVPCNTGSDCGIPTSPTDQRYICRPNERWMEENIGWNGDCQFVNESTGDGSSVPEKICEIFETCGEPDAEGNVECTQEEKCSFVSPYVNEDFYAGCGCGEVCSTVYRCVPGVCTSDSECEDCSYCRNGFCTPGCNEDNPCPPNECCGADSKCRPMCSKDEQCPFGWACGEGGCCAEVCNFGTPCITSADCGEGETCFESYCEEGCQKDRDCCYDEDCDDYVCAEKSDGIGVCFFKCESNDDCDLNAGELCTEDGYCKRPLGVCNSDDDCPLREFDNGEFLFQVCDKDFDRRDPKYQDLSNTQGVCRPGCRSDTQCPTSMLCLDGTSKGGGYCEYICNADDQCESLGYGNVCTQDQKAKAAAKRYYERVIKEIGTTIEKKRWSALAEDSNTGVCLTAASERDDGGKPVCAGYEDCSPDGCVRLPCVGDLDCPAGSCLSDGQCGTCRNANDCPGDFVCDTDDGCDENGENCDEIPTGTCAQPCIPETECVVDDDCPPDTYCKVERNQIGQTRNVCTPGCRKEVRCEVQNDCPTPEPSGQICFEQSCRFSFDCSPPQGSGMACLLNTDCPGTEVCKDIQEVEDEDGNIRQEGFCEPNVVVDCIDGRCVGGSGGCPYGEICELHGDPETYPDFDGICVVPKPACVNGFCDTGGAGTCYPGETCSRGECQQTCEIKKDGINAGVDPCGDGAKCIGGVCEYVGYSCMSDEDCPEEESECFDGKCRVDLRCGKHSDCPSSRMACVDNKCIDGKRCNDNSNCRRECEEETDCRSRPSSNSDCSDDRQCEGRELCLVTEEGNYRCTYPSAQCVEKNCSNVECDACDPFERDDGCTPTGEDAFDPCLGTKEVCIGWCKGEDPDDAQFCGPQGICLTGEACTGDGDCSFPDICHNNTCQFVVRCSSDSQCSAGLFCDDNVCQKDNRCGDDFDCLKGFFCNRSGRCQEIDQLEGGGFGSGCGDSCLEYCGQDFRCHKYICQKNEDCPCGGFCDETTGKCSNKCRDDTDCQAGFTCVEGECVPKEPCLNDIDCPGQTSCNDEGFCDGYYNHCLVDGDCDVGVCVDAECVDCRVDQDCIDNFAQGEGCDENGENCFNEQLVCFNNTCETPCYTGLTDGSCTEGLKYGDLCAFCPGSCPGGSVECQLDGTTCGEQVVWDPVARKEKFIQIECKRCVLECEEDTNCKQSCGTSLDCKQYDATGNPCDPNPGLPCSTEGGQLDDDVCPFPEESLLECEIDGKPNNQYCANGFETCQQNPENPAEPWKCRFQPILGGAVDQDNACAVNDALDNTNFLCEEDQNCGTPGEICIGGKCKLPPCDVVNGEYCNEGTCDYIWRVPTCKSNGRCLGTEADRALDPCLNGEVCGDENSEHPFLCDWPTPLCVENFCDGVGLIQDSVCEYDERKEGFFCEYFDGRCDNNSDCQRLTNLDGSPRYCREYECQIGELCIGNSDCNPGEVCEDMVDEDGNSLGVGSVCVLGPGWNENRAECTSNSDCGQGRTCIDRACAFICGPNVEAYPCRPSEGEDDPGILCPAEYNCNRTTNLCERPGYDGIDQFMEGCAKGQTCYKGACVPKKGGEGGGDGGGDGGGGGDDEKYECRQPQDCSEELCNAQKRTKWDCDKGRCVEVWLDEYPARPGEKMCTDPERVEDDEEEDICEQKGECCSDQGFCEPCGCDDENPCKTAGQCCDRNSGICVDLTLHPKTELGAPFSCSFDPVFCEVLGPRGDDGTRNEVDITGYQSRGYPGCQTIELADGTQQTKCWPGGPLEPKQIAVMLGQDCQDKEEEDECACEEEPPPENECYTSNDCGLGFGVCITKRFKSTVCCPVADEFGNDYVDRNICFQKGDDVNKEDVACFTDKDCTECETCEGVLAVGMNVFKGRCRAKCDLCPCGGPLSGPNRYWGKNECPSCTERFGEGCITEVETIDESEKIDPDTGLVIPARASCDCAVKQENDCCEAFEDKGPTGQCGQPGMPSYTLECRFRDLMQNRDGCVVREYKDDEGAITVGQVAYCKDFDQGICARCTEDSHCPGSAVCVDYECANECGNENELPVDGNCACCTEEFECKELYQSWSESRDAGERGTETRACACTSTGIQCQPWKEQESCYKWFLEDEGSGEEALAERERKLEEVAQKRDVDLPLAETEYDNAVIAKNEAQALVLRMIELENQACADLNPICQNAVDEWIEISRSVTAVAGKVQDAKNELNTLNGRKLNAEAAITEAEIQVDINCPNGVPDPEEPDPGTRTDACANAIEALATAQADFDDLVENLIPAAQEELDYWENFEEGILAEQEYWAELIVEACPEGFEPCNPETDECDEDSNGDQSPACQEAKTNRINAQNDLTQKQIDLNNAVLNFQQLEANITQLEAQIEETVYQPPVWVQKRVCGCCIDGECRDESECTYGTCYICPMGELKQGYRAMLYIKGNAQLYGSSPIESGCMDQEGKSLDSHKDCPDVGLINEIGGPTAIYFEATGDCVKYRCEDGISTIQEMCSGDFNSWYDYCIGSIVGCLFQDNDETDINWWNGYDYNLWCPLAGVWAYNSKSAPPSYNATFFTIVPPPSQGGDWVQLSRSKEGSARSSCAYPNPLGHLGPGQNWLHPMPDVYSMHPHCGPADVIHECSPENPGCQQPYELLFESGDPTLLIQRLEAQVEALKKYKLNLKSVDGQLDQLKIKKEGEKNGYQEQLNALDSGIEDIEVAIGKIKSDIIAKEAEIDAQVPITEKAIADFETAKDDLDAKSVEKNEAIVARDELQAQYDNTDALLKEAETNLANAKIAIATKSGEITTQKGELTSMHTQAEQDGCVCGWTKPPGDLENEPSDCPECPEPVEGEPDDCIDGPPNGDTIECVELMYAIQDKVEEIQILEGELDTLEGERDGWADEIPELNKSLAEQEGPLNEAKQLVISLTTEWAEMAENVETLESEMNTAIADLQRLRGELVALNNTLTQLESQLEIAQGTEGTKEDLEEAIALVDEVLENIKNSKELVDEECIAVNAAIEEKEGEIDRLEEEWCPEAEGDSCGKPVASDKPDAGRKLEELEKEYNETIEEKNQKEQDKWYPAGQQ